VIKKIVDYLSAVKVAQIASITGRYWAMDRDARWERTKKAYDAVVNGVGIKAMNRLMP
jgi:2,3-bisphosphoglycerate-independent phosphoglycerate mutase